MTHILPGHLLTKLSHMLQEEEIDIYMLMVYCMDSDDLNYFNEKDRKEVLKIFKILKEDTQHHANLLRLILDLGGEA